jgi:hypothetical protein
MAKSKKSMFKGVPCVRDQGGVNKSRMRFIDRSRERDRQLR